MASGDVKVVIDLDSEAFMEKVREAIEDSLTDRDVLLAQLVGWAASSDDRFFEVIYGRNAQWEIVLFPEDGSTRRFDNEALNDVLREAVASL